MINAIVSNRGGKLKQAEVVRDLVGEAVRARNLKGVGHDEFLFAVVKVQTGVVNEGIAPLVNSFQSKKSTSKKAWLTCERNTSKSKTVPNWDGVLNQSAIPPDGRAPAAQTHSQVGIKFMTSTGLPNSRS